ncbi:pH-dependent sodium/proton antiporter [Citromicrobium sp. RCC1885]|uniref:Na+/H+ antiporter NhaA n=1 Tax=unclassified Citromicrobium TaxID=2630544 RepID=UPI0006C8FCDD|nr:MULTISPECIES: Na+/H+ antiporter NhaA [unclassified Citromicrobium]KPM21782.1 pH-dependent sodium/proton antiporter [Citromicrobium sp. RCC1885]KPM23587.1 pH-dependent sodium/proton antiporter [Citromicrobium sp. RCC1878]MAO03362.1 Na+/H+ antiporter NhaA [Citromicrobium sp.]OAM06797.1 sodium:proton antiporter [Citromicrobium sp. RCC1897]|tara:strand:+ start:11944 stop:13146 length:1203 start_codon:yes stop_codon:yes gene_type:complete
MIVSAAAALRDFLKQESAGGIVLIAAAALALLAANTMFSGSYFGALDTPVTVAVGSFAIDKPLLLWINDGLMAVFFFLVGLEVKREVVEGQLSSWNQASLPLVAAIGGMAMPALIFVGLNMGSPANISGWAIPAATDIAFALGILSLLGPRVPVALKALLLAIAVIDDIGAITIIALFYSGSIDTAMLGGGALALAAMIVLNRFKVGSSIPYILLAIVLWVFILKSGVHATLAGVAAAMTIPMRARDGSQPLERMEHFLHPWVAFLVIPIFGFANAGVSLGGLEFADLLAPLPLGIALGLLIGKQLGIFGFAFVAVKTGLARLPENVGWRQVHGVSLLAAIGFTMSLFIGNLAFDSAAQVDAVKIGVLAGSVIAALAGFFLLKAGLPAAAETREEQTAPA